MAQESDFQLQNSAQAIEFGRESVRLGVTINGGAAVAVIGFLGSKDAVQNPSMIQDALKWFCLGVVLSFLASMMGYIAQTMFAVHNSKRVSGQPSSDKWAIIVSLLGISLVTGSVAGFVRGIYVAGQAIF
jgi:hypothetical protein